MLFFWFFHPRARVILTWLSPRLLTQVKFARALRKPAHENR
jgi:hypothetical protein